MEDSDRGTLGVPVNDRGGGVYALEWDPVGRHIRTWVFSPGESAPENLLEAMRTAKGGSDVGEERIAPNPDRWGLPYGYFPIGEFFFKFISRLFSFFSDAIFLVRLLFAASISLSLIAFRLAL